MLQNEVEVANTRSKLQRLEERYEAAEKEADGDEVRREAALVSLKRLINQFKEEIAQLRGAAGRAALKLRDRFIRCMSRRGRKDIADGDSKRRKGDCCSGIGVVEVLRFTCPRIAPKPGYIHLPRTGRCCVEGGISFGSTRSAVSYEKQLRWWPSKQFPVPPAERDQHLEAFKESVRGKRGPNPSNLSDNEWWALAQHHGLTTPLLDWTYSPFVALFFAFEEEGYINWRKRELQLPRKRAVYVALWHLITKNGTADFPAPTVFSPRREITNRLSSQSALHMKMPLRSDLESNVRARFSAETSASDRHARPILRKFIIPSDGRVDCLKFLDKMNINRMSLFADLDGAARYINGLWELGFDTPLGLLPDGA